MNATVNGVADPSQSRRPESSCEVPGRPRESALAQSSSTADSSVNGPAAASVAGPVPGSEPGPALTAPVDLPVQVSALPSDAPVVLSTAEDSGPPSGPGIEDKTPAPTYLDLPGDGPVLAREDEFELLFFDELPTESWLAHELEMGDPRMIQKMTETAVRRRAHFAKYVKGIVGAAAAICLVAAIKASIPSGDSGFVPAVDQLPAAAAQAPGVPFARDGGGW
jgi:hypothetical protein